METTTNYEADQSDNLNCEQSKKINFFLIAPSFTRLIIYVLSILILFLFIGLILHWFIDYDEANNQWIRTVKFNNENDQYFRHPKY